MHLQIAENNSIMLRSSQVLVYYDFLMLLGGRVPWTISEAPCLLLFLSDEQAPSDLMLVSGFLPDRDQV